MVDRKEANLQKLREADEIQGKTKEAIFRIQKQAAEAEGLGVQTLEELRRQGQQMDDINTELEGVSVKLDQSAALQSKFDKWAGNWLGAVTCNDVFDPAIQETVENSKWSVDFTLSGIDADGWTVKDRNEARKNKASAAASSKNADKIGYVPRNKQASELKASGLTSSKMSGKNGPSDQDLDDESAAGLNKLKENDAEIDAGIDAISRTIDNLSGIAATMKEETLNQMDKLDKIDNRMDSVTTKTTVFSPLIEIGSGKGYWSKLLQNREGGPEKLLESVAQGRNLFLCYPDEAESIAIVCLENFTGEYIIHVGELMANTTGTMAGAPVAPYGRTSSAEFQITLAEQFHCLLICNLSLRYPYSKDCISVWKRTNYVAGKDFPGDHSSQQSGSDCEEEEEEESEEDDEEEISHPPTKKSKHSTQKEDLKCTSKAMEYVGMDMLKKLRGESVE
eukprot:gene27559-34298_t